MGLGCGEGGLVGGGREEMRREREEGEGGRMVGGWGAYRHRGGLW